jgi:hypothetical protein
VPVFDRVGDKALHWVHHPATLEEWLDGPIVYKATWKEEPMGIEERIKELGRRLEDRTNEIAGETIDALEKKAEKDISFCDDLWANSNSAPRISIHILLGMILEHLDVMLVSTPQGMEFQPRPTKEEEK